MTSFVYDTAKAIADEASKIALTDHDAEIAAVTPKQNEQSGNCMVNLRWRINAGTDDGKTVFDRLLFVSDAYGINVKRIEQFCAAIGRDPAIEFGGQEIDMAFLTEWAETLLGESATIKVGIDKGSTGQDGTVYPPKPEVKGYKPYGSAANASDLKHLDDLL